VNSIVIVSRTENDLFDSVLSKSLNNINTKCVNVADKPDSDDLKTLGKKYNIGLDVALKNNIISHDTIVLFMKPEAYIMDNSFVEKFAIIFNRNPNIGLVGVVGSEKLTENVSLLDEKNIPHNSIVMGNETLIKFNNDTGFYNNIIGVSDICFAIKGDVLLSNNILFDDAIDCGVGIDICTKMLELGYDVTIADILISAHGNIDTPYEYIENIVDMSNGVYSKDDVNVNNNHIVNIEL